MLEDTFEMLVVNARHVKLEQALTGVALPVIFPVMSFVQVCWRWLFVV